MSTDFNPWPSILWHSGSKCIRTDCLLLTKPLSRDTLPAVSVFPASHSHFTRKLRLWQAHGLVAAFLLGLTTIYFWRQLVGGQALYWGDVGLYFLPMQIFLKQNMSAGRLPLWNPLILCGTPYFGNPQTWPLYPVTALLPLVSATQFINLTIALHVWLAGLGTYAFARRALNVSAGPALLAAVTFMFGGQLVSKEQFPNMVQASAWLPWVLFCLHQLLTRKRVQDALALGLVLGLQLLAAHVQMTLLTLYLAVAYGAASVPPAPNNGGARLRKEGTSRIAPSGSALTPPLLGAGGTLALLLLALATASGLAMGQLLPTLALFRDAARQRLSFAVVDRFYLPFDQLGNFVVPTLHGSPYFGNWTARGNLWETCCYVGALPLALALWGGMNAFVPAGSRPARFWVGVFFVGVWMALGGEGGLYHLAYFVLPGFRSFHDPARCLLPACFALSLLAAYGLEQVPRFRQRHFIIAAALLLAFADLAHFGRTLYPLANPAALYPASPNVAVVQSDPDIAAHQARILAPTNGIWLRFSTPRDFRQTAPNYQTLWADTLTPNLMMPYGVYDAFGYEPVALKNIEAASVAATRAFDPKAAPSSRNEAAPLSGALGVKYIAVCRVTPPERTLPGLVSVRAAPTLAPPGRQHGPEALLYLSRNTPWQPRAHLEGETSAAVRVTEDGPDQVALSFQTAMPDRLILEDTQAASWQATLDGQQVPIRTYQSCLRAVDVPASGLHRVVFTYAPTPFRLGLYLSLLTLSLLVGAASFGVTRKLAEREGFRGKRAE